MYVLLMRDKNAKVSYTVKISAHRGKGRKATGATLVSERRGGGGRLFGDDFQV